MMLMVPIVLAVVIVWHPSRVLAPPMPYGLLHFPALVSCALCVRNSEELLHNVRAYVKGGGEYRREEGFLLRLTDDDE